MMCWARGKPGTLRHARTLRDIIGADEARKWRQRATSGSQQPASGGPRPVRAAQLQEMAQRIAPELTRETKTVNRWNGTIRLDAGLGSAGRKEWNCTITLWDDPEFLNRPAHYWPILNHEMLHALSTGLTPASHSRFRGWEEGVVGKLQRILGPRVLQQIGEEPYVGNWAYNPYVAGLERLRTFLGRAERPFYLNLIRTPLAEREQLVRSMGPGFKDAQASQWQQLLMKLRLKPPSERWYYTMVFKKG
ncbi:MAG: hypothetical protein HY675_18990 [Chloroflexi bacterium]|nr:hypothetical protein [Chloroflexota bacterium]